MSQGAIRRGRGDGHQRREANDLGGSLPKHKPRRRATHTRPRRSVPRQASRTPASPVSSTTSLQKPNVRPSMIAYTAESNGITVVTTSWDLQ